MSKHVSLSGLFILLFLISLSACSGGMSVIKVEGNREQNIYIYSKEYVEKFLEEKGYPRSNYYITSMSRNAEGDELHLMLRNVSERKGVRLTITSEGNVLSGDGDKIEIYNEDNELVFHIEDINEGIYFQDGRLRKPFEYFLDSRTLYIYMPTRDGKTEIANIKNPDEILYNLDFTTDALLSTKDKLYFFTYNFPPNSSDICRIFSYGKDHIQLEKELKFPPYEPRDVDEETGDILFAEQQDMPAALFSKWFLYDMSEQKLIKIARYNGGYGFFLKSNPLTFKKQRKH